MLIILLFSLLRLVTGYISLSVSVVLRKSQTGAQVVIRFKHLTSK